MLQWLKRVREDRQIEEAVRFGPPYLSDLQQLSELLHTDYAGNRVKVGHA